MSLQETRVPYYSSCWIEIDGVRFGDKHNRADISINAAAPTVSLIYENDGPYNFPVFDNEISGNNQEDVFNNLLTQVQKQRGSN